MSGSPALLERLMGVPQKRGSTRSGRATLVELDEADARELQPGDEVLTPAPGGYWLLAVRCVREATHGELGEDAQLCVVVDTEFDGQIAGGTLTYAPADLLRVAVSR